VAGILPVSSDSIKQEDIQRMIREMPKYPRPTPDEDAQAMLDYLDELQREEARIRQIHRYEVLAVAVVILIFLLMILLRS
jgi:hypothetical protein